MLTVTIVFQSCDKLGEAVLSVDTTSDIRKAVDQKGSGPNQPEQLLPDFYVSGLLRSLYICTKSW